MNKTKRITTVNKQTNKQTNRWLNLPKSPPLPPGDVYLCSDWLLWPLVLIPTEEHSDFQRSKIRLMELIEKWNHPFSTC